MKMAAQTQIPEMPFPLAFCKKTELKWEESEQGFSWGLTINHKRSTFHFHKRGLHINLTGFQLLKIQWWLLDLLNSLPCFNFSSWIIWTNYFTHHMEKNQSSNYSLLFRLSCLSTLLVYNRTFHSCKYSKFVKTLEKIKPLTTVCATFPKSFSFCLESFLNLYIQWNIDLFFLYLLVITSNPKMMIECIESQLPDMQLQ